MISEKKIHEGTIEDLQELENFLRKLKDVKIQEFDHFIEIVQSLRTRIENIDAFGDTLTEINDRLLCLEKGIKFQNSIPTNEKSDATLTKNDSANSVNPKGGAASNQATIKINPNSGAVPKLGANVKSSPSQKSDINKPIMDKPYNSINNMPIEVTPRKDSPKVVLAQPEYNGLRNSMEEFLRNWQSTESIEGYEQITPEDKLLQFIVNKTYDEIIEWKQTDRYYEDMAGYALVTLKGVPKYAAKSANIKINSCADPYFIVPTKQATFSKKRVTQDSYLLFFDFIGNLSPDCQSLIKKAAIVDKRNGKFFLIEKGLIEVK